MRGQHNILDIDNTNMVTTNNSSSSLHNTHTELCIACDSCCNLLFH